MLSNTHGLKRRYEHKTATEVTVASTPCPHLARTGKCHLFNVEQTARHKLAVDFEGRVAKMAKEMFELQQGEAAEKKTPSAHLLTLQEVTMQVRKEKQFEDWSIDLAVMEELRSRRVKRCLHNHNFATADGDINQQQQPQALQQQQHPVYAAVLALLRRGTVEVPARALADLADDDVVNQVMDATMASSPTAHDDPTNEQETAGGGVDVAQLLETLRQRREQTVRLTVMQREHGIVNLTGLPTLLPYFIATHNSEVVAEREKAKGSSNEKKGQLRRSSADGQLASDGSKRTATTTRSKLGRVLESEVNLSNPTIVKLVFDAIQAALAGGTSSTEGDDANTSTDAREDSSDIVGESVPLRWLTLRRCKIVDGDAIVAQLKKIGTGTTLRALDMAHNKLDSLRFLFALRAYFGKQLAMLHLIDNPITKKPNYVEQVAKTLPNLVTLDGQRIRKPPLKFPFPTDSQRSLNMSQQEYATVSEFLGHFFHCLETREIAVEGTESYLNMEKETSFHAFCQNVSSSAAAIGDDDDEEGSANEPPFRPVTEIDEQNFALKFFHPSAVFSLCVHPGCSWFDDSKMKSKVAVESELTDSEVQVFDGLRLSKLDVKELRLSNVCISNSARNLMVGKEAVHRIARGPLPVFTSYQSTVYPQRFLVRHHLHLAKISVQKISDHDIMMAPPKKNNNRSHAKQGQGQQGDDFFGASSRQKPNYYIVTMHGKMTWQVPTMRGGEHLEMLFDRVMTLVPMKPIRSSIDALIPAAEPMEDDVEARMASRRKQDKELTKKQLRYQLKRGGGKVVWESSAGMGKHLPQPTAKESTGGECDDDDDDVVGSESEHDDDEGEEENVAAAILTGKSKYQLYIYNDQLTLRPAKVAADETKGTTNEWASTVPSTIVYSPFDEEHVDQLAVEFGLAEPHERHFIRAVVEQSNSDAAVHETLKSATTDPQYSSSSAAPGAAAAEENSNNRIAPVVQEDDECSVLKRRPTNKSFVFTPLNPEKDDEDVAPDDNSLPVATEDITNEVQLDTEALRREITIEDLRSLLERSRTKTTASFAPLSSDAEFKHQQHPSSRGAHGKRTIFPAAEAALAPDTTPFDSYAPKLHPDHEHQAKVAAAVAESKKPDRPKKAKKKPSSTKKTKKRARSATAADKAEEKKPRRRPSAKEADTTAAPAKMKTKKKATA